MPFSNGIFLSAGRRGIRKRDVARASNHAVRVPGFDNLRHHVSAVEAFKRALVLICLVRLDRGEPRVRTAPFA
jgi:hypothetical protein